MRKSRFREAQIVVVLKQAEVGVPIQELIREYGISEQTSYRWRKKFGGLAPVEYVTRLLAGAEFEEAV